MSYVGLLVGDPESKISITSYVLDPYGNPVSQTTGASTTYFLTDNIGLVRGLTNSTGALAQRFDYDPFGNLLTGTVTTDSHFRFAGGYWDSQTKLYHFSERFYDPDHMTWTQRDSLGGTPPTQ